MNAPSSKNARDRVLIATPVDPSGTYSIKTKQDIHNVIGRVAYDKVAGCSKDKKKCVTGVNKLSLITIIFKQKTQKILKPCLFIKKGNRQIFQKFFFLFGKFQVRI